MLKRCCHILFPLLLSGFSVSAGGPPDTLLLRSAGYFTDDSVSCVLPFTRAGNLILLKGKADTTEGNFILDTGSPHLVLNIIYFRQYPSREEQTQQNSVTGAGSLVVRTNVQEFTLGNLDYYKLEADLVDLGHIENSKGVRILGLLGMDLFRQCEMIIDYDKSLIYLHRIARKEVKAYQHAMLLESEEYTAVPIELMDNRIVATVTLGGKKLKFMIDSGAESNLLDSRLPEKVFEQVNITGRVILSGTGTRKVEALSGDLQKLQIGNRVIGSLPVVITNLEKTCISYDGCIDGMLGFDFLSLHKIGFNFVKRKMYIWK